MNEFVVSEQYLKRLRCKDFIESVCFIDEYRNIFEKEVIPYIRKLNNQDTINNIEFYDVLEAYCDYGVYPIDKYNFESFVRQIKANLHYLDYHITIQIVESDLGREDVKLYLHKRLSGLNKWFNRNDFLREILITRYKFSESDEDKKDILEEIRELNKAITSADGFW